MCADGQHGTLCACVGFPVGVLDAIAISPHKPITVTIDSFALRFLVNRLSAKCSAFHTVPLSITRNASSIDRTTAI